MSQHPHDPPVVIFVKNGDPYSVRAVSLLRLKGIVFLEKQVPPHGEEMLQLSGKTVTPQIFIHGKHIGSYEELGSLELQGKLDDLLQ